MPLLQINTNNIVPFGVRTFKFKFISVFKRRIYILIIYITKILWLRILTGRGQAVLVSISMAEEFNVGLPEQIKLVFGLALKPRPLDYSWDAPSTCLSLAASQHNAQ